MTNMYKEVETLLKHYNDTSQCMKSMFHEDMCEFFQNMNNHGDIKESYARLVTHYEALLDSYKSLIDDIKYYIPKSTAPAVREESVNGRPEE